MKVFLFVLALVLAVYAVEIPELTPDELVEIAHGDTEDTWFIKLFVDKFV